jgi:NAD(P)-dependent dehydrogenase (short-subunit alcohol dehydrogenase family)
MSTNKVHQGKVAIVSGSSKNTGIGAAIATALAKEGANVSKTKPKAISDVNSRVSRS